MKKGQSGRTGTGKKYTINGETMTIAQFAKKYKLTPDLIRNRIHQGCGDDKILKSTQEILAMKPLSTYEQRQSCLSWTNAALDCYEIGANCRNCKLPKDIKKICHMKERILKIVKLYGKPYDRKNNFLEV